MAIIVRVHGGLGNQLFQYAFGRGVSSRLKTDLLIDRSPFLKSRYDPHVYHNKPCFAHLNIRVQFAKDSDMFGFVWLRKHRKFFDQFYDMLRLKRALLPFYYPERTFAFDPEVFSHTNTYFDGYWQTEKYFKHRADELRAELAPAKPLSGYAQNMLNEIKRTNAISLHVRRADYVTDPNSSVFHGICSLEYYQHAIAYITQRIPSPHFFIFSDDYEWSVENFKFLNYPFTCVRGSEEKNYEDMHLMSRCAHHIIANSSFSWWGAWLNPRPDKIVIAPKVWFANAPKADTRDLLPDEWIKM